MDSITIIDEGNPDSVQHVKLAGTPDTDGVDSESVDITHEQIARNIEDSECIMDYLAGRI